MRPEARQNLVLRERFILTKITGSRFSISYQVKTKKDVHFFILKYSFRQTVYLLTNVSFSAGIPFSVFLCIQTHFSIYIQWARVDVPVLINFNFKKILEIAICIPLFYISINKVKMCFDESHICAFLWKNWKKKITLRARWELVKCMIFLTHVMVAGKVLSFSSGPSR